VAGNRGLVSSSTPDGAVSNTVNAAQSSCNALRQIRASDRRI